MQPNSRVVLDLTSRDPDELERWDAVTVSTYPHHRAAGSDLALIAVFVFVALVAIATLTVVLAHGRGF